MRVRKFEKKAELSKNLKKLHLFVVKVFAEIDC